METNRYVFFDDLNLAKQFLDDIKQSLNTQDNWSNPNKHPFKENWIVPWNDLYLVKASHLLERKTILTPNEVLIRGWEFHNFFEGPFANVRLKIDQAQFLQDGFKTASRHPNFPVYRALFFSLLSSFYSIREALNKTCAQLSPEASSWWKQRKEEIWKDKIAKYFHELNNAEKHDLNPNPLKISAKIYGVQVTAPPQGFRGRIMISAEGTFGIENENTARERRIYLPGTDIERTVILLSAQGEELGNPVDLSSNVLNIYENATFDCRKMFSPK